jgi:hypothetical protein
LTTLSYTKYTDEVGKTGFGRGETMSDVEDRLKELGIELPDYVTEPDYLWGKGNRTKGDDSGVYGIYKPHHIVGNMLLLCGHVGELHGKATTGILGKDVSIEQGYASARQAAINALGGVRYAIGGDWDKLVSLMRLLVFVAATPDFTDIHKVSSGSSDLFLEVLGEERGLICRATIGSTVLATNHCVELWLDAEIKT